MNMFLHHLSIVVALLVTVLCTTSCTPFRASGAGQCISVRPDPMLTTAELPFRVTQNVGADVNSGQNSALQPIIWFCSRGGTGERPRGAQPAGEDTNDHGSHNPSRGDVLSAAMSAAMSAAIFL